MAMADQRDNDDFQRGCRLAEQGKYIEATNYFSRVSSNCEKYGQSQYLLGCALNKLNRFDSYRESFEAFARAKEYFREKKLKIPLHLYYQQGWTQFQCGEYLQSIQNLTLFIHKSDENERYLGCLTRAQIYNHLHFYDEALQDVNEINQNENYRTMFSICFHGRILSLLHRFDEANECFQMALQMKTNERDKDFHLGFIYSELGEYSRAMKHYQLALNSSNVDRAEIYFRQGLIHHLSNEFDQAKMKYQSALELNEEHSRTLFHLSRLYREENNVNEALKTLKIAHNSSPFDREILDELSSIYREENQRRLALFYQSQSLKIEQIDLTNLVLNDDEVEEEEEEEEEEEIIARRILHPDLLWSLEQESNLPISENRLVLYQQIVEHYEKAIENVESVESRIFLSLCQESENDFIRSFDSMKQFYRDLRENSPSKENWKIFFKEFDEDFQNGNLSSLMIVRHSVLKRVDQLQRDIDEDYQHLRSNEKLFYERFFDDFVQLFIALSIVGRNSTVREKNLKGPTNTIRWMIEYLSMKNIYVRTFGSKLKKFRNHFQQIEDKSSLFSRIGDLTDFFSFSRELTRTIVDDYSDKFEQIENSSIERLADFLVKFLLETIRDKSFEELNLSKNRRTKFSDLKSILVRWVPQAKSNYSPGLFSFDKNPFENDLLFHSSDEKPLIRSTNEFFHRKSSPNL